MMEGLQLSADEWLFAPWRPRTIQPRPPARPFSKVDAHKALRRLLRAWRTRSAWNESGITAAISREEALFWLHANFALHRYVGIAPEKLEEQAGAWDLNAVPDREKTLRYLEDIPSPLAVLIILDRLYGWPAVLRLVEHIRPTGYHGRTSQYDDTFRRGLLPYLTEAELDPLRDVVRTRIGQTNCPGIALVLAGLIGVPDAVAKRLPGVLHGEPLERAAFFGLGSAADVVSRRDWLGRPYTETDVIVWLAHTGLDQLEWLANGLLNVSAPIALPMVRAMAARITAAKAAPHFLMLMEKNRGAAPALEWLLADPERTLRGLDGHTWNRKNKLGREMCDAEEALRRRLGRPSPSSNPPGVELPDELTKEFAQARVLRAKLPAWLATDLLPAIRVGPNVVREATLVSAAFSTIGVDPLEDHSLAAALRRHADPSSLDLFARDLFSLWRHAGMPPKDRWALGSIGLLGGEESARELIPHLRKWPGASRFTIAKLGYEALLWVLRRIDSKEILWLVRQAGEGSSMALEFFKMFAIERDQTQEQLEDLILPHPPECLFDYGPRQFKSRIGPDGCPVFIESNGDRHAKPPKPKRTDDQTKAEAAREAWKTLEKELSQVRKFALRRLESSWLAGMHWIKEDFEGVALPHPVYAPLCRLLVWGCVDAQNELIGTFRVTEDGRYADSDDRPFTLPAETRTIGLPKPADFANPEREKWRQIFDDYNLIPLLPQLISPWPGLPADWLDSAQLALGASYSLESLDRALRTSGYSCDKFGGGWSKSFDAQSTVAILFRAPTTNGVRCRLTFQSRGAALTARSLHPKVIDDILFDISQMQLRFETKP